MIVQFKPHHFSRLNIRPEDNHYPVMAIKRLAELSFTVSLIINDKTISIGGLYKMGPTTAHIWQVPSEEAAQYRLAFCKAAKTLVGIAKAMGYKKLTTDVRQDKMHKDWIHFLEFYPTGDLGPNNTLKYEREI